MAYTWQDVERHPDFINAPDEEKQRIRSEYDQRVAQSTVPETTIEQPVEQPKTQGGLNPAGAVADIGRAIYDFPTHALGAAGSFFASDDLESGVDPDKIPELTLKRASERRSEERRGELTPEQREETLLPFKIPFLDTAIKRSDIIDASSSSGFSAATMGGNVAALPLAYFSPAVARGVGLALSGKIGYDISKTDITLRVLESFEKVKGEELTDDERKSILEQTAELRSNSALWEAGPEAVGNALQISGLGSIFKGVGKGKVGQLVKGMFTTYTGELSTETLTEMGQQPIAVELGLSDEVPYNMFSLEDWGTAFRQIAPATVVLVTALSSGGAIAGKTYDSVVEEPKRIQNIKDVVNEGKFDVIPNEAFDDVLSEAYKVAARNKGDEELKLAVDSLELEKDRRNQNAESRAEAQRQKNVVEIGEQLKLANVPTGELERIGSQREDLAPVIAKVLEERQFDVEWAESVVADKKLSQDPVRKKRAENILAKQQQRHSVQEAQEKTQPVEEQPVEEIVPITAEERETLQALRTKLESGETLDDTEQTVFDTLEANENVEELYSTPLVESGVEEEVHRAAVQQAVDTGQFVPAEVLEDYPDIVEPDQIIQEKTDGISRVQDEGGEAERKTVEDAERDGVEGIGTEGELAGRGQEGRRSVETEGQEEKEKIGVEAGRRSDTQQKPDVEVVAEILDHPKAKNKFVVKGDIETIQKVVKEAGLNVIGRKGYGGIIFDKKHRAAIEKGLQTIEPAQKPETTTGKPSDAIGAIRSVLPQEESDAVVAIIEARANAVGKSVDQYLTDRGIKVEALGKSGIVKEGDKTVLRKAAVEIQGDTKAIIKAFNEADVSSFVHELGHIFRQELSGAELKTVEDWAGVKDGKWDRDAEEKFARAFERYLAEGNAPNVELQSVFDKLRDWMLSIYQGILNTSIDVKISPELRQVLDGLFIQKVESLDIKNETLGSALPTMIQQIEEGVGDNVTFDESGKEVTGHIGSSYPLWTRGIVSAETRKRLGLKSNIKMDDVLTVLNNVQNEKTLTERQAIILSEIESRVAEDQDIQHLNRFDKYTINDSGNLVDTDGNVLFQEESISHMSDQLGVSQEVLQKEFDETRTKYEGVNKWDKSTMLEPDVISKLVSHLDYGDSIGAISYLKDKGITHISGFNVSSIDSSPMEEGIMTGASWYGRDEAVYFFADPDDIKQALPYLAMKVDDGGGDVLVSQFEISVDALKNVEWDGFFASQFNAYSSLFIKEDIKPSSVISTRLFRIPSAEEFKNGDTGEYVNKSQIGTAPNGKPSNLNDHLWVLVRTPRFKKWFSGSEVVDENGEPLQLYHGTLSDFKSFDKGKIKSRFPFSIAFHFTDRIDEADKYASGVDPKFKGVPDGASIMPVFVSLKNPYVISTKEASASIEADLNKGMWIPELVKAKRAGNPYDGVVIKREKGDGFDGVNVIAFEPNSIKSIFNRGRFGETGDILYQSEQIKPIQSKLAIVSNKFENRKAQGVENMLTKLGVSKAEMEAVGLKSWLRSLNKTTTLKGAHDSGVITSDPSGDFSDSDTFIIPLPSSVKVPSYSALLFDSSLVKRIATNAKDFSDIPPPKSISEQSFRSLDINIRRLVKDAVLAASQDLKIFKAIIESIPIDVMNNLTGGKFSTKEILDNPSVFKDALSVNGDSSIPPFVDIALASIVSNSTGSAAKIISLPIDLARLARDGRFAKFALNNDHSNLQKYLFLAFSYNPDAPRMQWRNVKVTGDQLRDFVRNNMVEVEDVILADKGDIETRYNPQEVDSTNEQFLNDISERQSPKVAVAWYPTDIDDAVILEHTDRKFEVLDDGTQVGIYDSLYDADNALGELTGGNTKFDTYQEPGGTDYKELFVVAPSKDTSLNQDAQSQFGKPFDELTQSELSLLESSRLKWQDGHSEYSDIQNPVVRLRFNTRTDADGDKILFIEEIQGPSPSNQEKMPDYLKDNIYQTGVKRILAYAKDNGFDGVGWTTGEMQIIRYEEAVRKAVDEIRISKHTDGYQITGKKDGSTVISKDKLDEKDVEKEVGKEISKKAIEELGEKRTGSVLYSGLDLKVGGEGLKRLYDETLPNMFKAYGKGKVFETEVVTGVSKGKVYKTDTGKWAAESPDGTLSYHETEQEAVSRIFKDKGGVKIPVTPITSKTPDTYTLFQEEELFQGEEKKTKPAKKVKGSMFTTGREYTEEQKRAIEKGGFGVKETETFTEKFTRSKTLLGAKLRQGIVDQYDSFKRILKDDTAWMMAHLTNSDTGALMTAVNVGTPILDKSGAIDIVEGSESLKDILKPLGNEIDDFFRWIAGHRAENLKAEDRENLFTDEQIEALKSLNKGKMADGRNRLEVYRQASLKFNRLGNAVVKIAVDTGLINRSEAQRWKDEGWYVPFYRMLEDGGAKGPSNLGSLTGQKGYQKLKGGKSQLDDLLTNVLMNWNHLISAGLRNQAGSKALKTAEQMGIVWKVPKEVKSKDAIYIRENGQEVWYEVDETQEGELVLSSLLSLNYEGLNTGAMKVIRGFKRVLTVGVTASPGFKIRNLLRDTLHAAAVATVSPNVFKNVFVGWKSDTKRMEAGGGAFAQSGYIHGSDPDAVKRLVGNGVSEEEILNTGSKIKKMWDAYQDFGARLENINRVASFENDLKKGKSLLEANFNARDQLDFSRTGSFTAIRFLAQVVPFMNARLQGLDKLGRSAMDKNQRKQFYSVVGMYAMASTLLYLFMSDDDDYEEAEDWEKRTYHLFKIPGSEKMYRFPRPFEVGAIAYMAEKMTEQFVDENAKFKEVKSALAHTISDTFAFNPIPQAFKPVVEVYSNKNMFTGRNIESMSMANTSKHERYQPWTSELSKGTSVAMSKILPETITLSPVQVEHLVRAYTGWAGATVLAGIDGTIRYAIDKEMPSREYYEYDPVKTFVRNNQGKGSKYMTQFYDNLAELNRLNGDIRKYKGTDKAKEIREKNINKVKYSKRYNRYLRRLSKFRKRIRAVYANRELTSKQKRAKIDMYKDKMNELAKRIVIFTSESF